MKSNLLSAIILRYFLLALALGGTVLFFKILYKKALTREIRFSIIWLAIIVLYAGILIVNSLFPTEGIIGWDDASNTLRGLTIAKDIIHGDWSQFWDDTNMQTIWGPGYAWLFAWLYIVLGKTNMSGSFLSLIFFLMSVFVLYQIGLKMNQQKGWLIGSIAAILMLTTPYAVKLSALAMIEPVLLFLLPFAIVIRMNIDGESSHFKSIIYSLIVVFIFLTKYNYGFLLFTATLIADILILFQTIESRKRAKELLNLIIFGYAPLLLVIVLWFFWEPSKKIEGFLFFMKNVPRVESSLLSEYRLLYYPKLFLSEYCVFKWFPVIIVPFFIIGLWDSYHRNSVRISIFFIISLIAVTIHPLKDTRYFVPFLPFLWLLMASGIVTSIEWVSQRFHDNIAKVLYAITIIFFLIITPYYQYSNLTPKARYLSNESLSPNPFVAKSIKEILIEINHEAEERDNLLIIGTFAELSPALIKLHLHTDTATPDTNHDLLIDSLENESKDYEKSLSSWINSHPDYSIITIRLSDNSPFFGQDYEGFNIWKRKYIDILNTVYRKHGLKLRYEKEFPEFGIAVKIYRQKQGKIASSIVYDFEQGIKEWKELGSKVQIAQTNTKRRAGKMSLKITGTGETGQWSFARSEKTPVSPGKLYKLSSWMLIEAISNDSSNFKCEFWSGDKWLKNIESNRYDLNKKGQWQELTAVIEVPDEKGVSLGITVEKHPMEKDVDATIFIDDIKIEKID